MTDRGQPDSAPRGWLGDYVAHPKHGPLPAMLIVLTVSTGMVDAVSILALGRVFVANMTGNVVFIGFALAGAPGFSLQASLVALAGFLAGAGIGGVNVTRYANRRGLLLRNTVAMELALLVAATTVLWVATSPYQPLWQDVTVALAGVGLGLQNAAVRALAVPDLTTTVLTMTLTAVAADIRKRDYRIAVRRIIAVTAMLVGAVAGAALTLHAGAAAALTVTCVLVAGVMIAATTAAANKAPWQTA